MLLNSDKYTDQAGRIWLTSELDNSEAVIRVRDTGIGIDLELLPHIFDLFTQAHWSLARSQGGLGIQGGGIRPALGQAGRPRSDCRSPGICLRAEMEELSGILLRPEWGRHLDSLLMAS